MKDDFDEIEAFMQKTFKDCMKYDISIKLNIDTGRMEWMKGKKTRKEMIGK